MAEPGTLTAEHFDDLDQEHDAANLGMWVFLATEVLFFGVLFASYLITRIHFPEAFAEASAHTDRVLGTLETAVLLTSSLTMAFALRAAKLGGRGVLIGLLLVTAALGLVFLGIHGYEYHHDYTEGLLPGFHFTYDGPHAQGVELFFFLYFVMTGFHLLHVTLGVIVIATIAVLAWRNWFNPDYYIPVELTALYWDFVDIVWMFLFPSFYLVLHL